MTIPHVAWANWALPDAAQSEAEQEVDDPQHTFRSFEGHTMAGPEQWGDDDEPPISHKAIEIFAYAIVFGFIGLFIGIQIGARI